MKKAIEILKQLNETINKAKSRGYLYSEIAISIEMEKAIKQALAELQEITQEESCKSCKYRETFKYTYDNKLICEECIRGKEDHYTPKG